MQVTIEKPATVSSHSGFRLSVEAVAYIVLVAFALILRFAELDTVPLAATETHRALAAWQYLHGTNGTIPLVADSPLIFWSQVTAFTLGNATEIGARLFTVIASIGLILSPLLFRSLFGVSRTFFISLMLAISPVHFLAARFTSPSVWALFAVMVLLWALWRFYEQPHPFFVSVAGISFAVLILSGPDGLPLALILALAALLALFRSVLSAPERLDLPGDDLLLQVREHFQSWSWWHFVSALSLTLIIGATAFFMYPGGFTMIGEAIVTTFSRFAPPDAGLPSLFPLMTALFYEPFLWILALIGVVLLISRLEMTYTERFLFFWVIVGILLFLIYPGVGADAALWLIVPLTGLASVTTDEFFVEGRTPLLYWLQESENFWQNHVWVRWMLAAITLSLLLVFTIHVQTVARALMTIPSEVDVFSILGGPAYINLRYSLIWVGIVPLFIIIGFFLTGSIWGNRLPIQGAGLGFFAFILLTNLGSGWNAAVTFADDPREFWHVTASASEVRYLRETLHDLTMRDSLGFRNLPITILLDDDVIQPDSLLMWELREFDKARYVSDIATVWRDQIIILPANFMEPDLGGAYVGQDFVLERFWDVNAIRPATFLSWWLQRQTLPEPAPQVYSAVILWLRQDVYDGIPPAERS